MEREKKQQPKMGRRSERLGTGPRSGEIIASHIMPRRMDLTGQSVHMRFDS
jgi:hypothetical protein